MSLGLVRISDPWLVSVCLVSWHLGPDCGVKIFADWGGCPKGVI